MAENESAPPAVECEDDDIDTPGYKPPAQKTLEEIQNADADDESLVRYKQQLLGNVGTIDGKLILSFFIVLRSTPIPTRPMFVQSPFPHEVAMLHSDVSSTLACK